MNETIVRVVENTSLISLAIPYFLSVVIGCLILGFSANVIVTKIEKRTTF